ncbi:hypothetical protein GCM10011502_25860 [Oceanisphaera marina]|uniref:Uncharacterized protein n=1 Tax=Oceanisphaera marina TaxID=2017550 RepID=A0ABQ1IVK2_9GAMM|nr:hypothetical protein [Oceanisphaera marina]GGB51573.1 hypothetical protein GCM10011502_25860 [Oceanisphaera marina]
MYCQLYVGKASRKVGKRPGQIAQVIFGYAQAHHAGQALIPHVLPGLGILAQHLAGVAQQAFTGCRGHRHLQLALQQRAFQYIFQPLDVRAYRGLRQMQVVGGGSKAAFVDHGNKAFQ